MRLSIAGAASGPGRPPRKRQFAALSSAVILGAACLGAVTTFRGASAHTFGTPATTPNPSSGTVGTELGDTAHLNEDVTADRTIRFELFSNANCTGNPVFTDEVPAPADDAVAEDSGADDVTTDETFAATAPGTWQWVASIVVTTTGAVETHTNCGDEPVTITSGGGQGTTTTSTTKTDTDTDTDTTSKTTTTKSESSVTTTSGGVGGISTSTTSTKSTITGGELGITTGGSGGVTVAPNTGGDLPLGEALALIIPGLGMAGLGLRSAVRRKVPPA